MARQAKGRPKRKTRGGAVASTAIFVQSIPVDAHIGVHPHEKGRVQTLLVDTHVTLKKPAGVSLDETVNYEFLVQATRDAAKKGHVLLIETFAEQVAHALLAHPRVQEARVRVVKPSALAAVTDTVGVELSVSRGRH